MMVWHENIVHSRNEPFDDAWTCHVDLIITHHGFYFALLFSCWTHAMQNHNAKVGLSSYKSILQRLPFPMILSFVPVWSPVHHGCELLLLLHTFTDYWSDRRGPRKQSPSSWVLCLFYPSGSLQSSGDVNACTYYKQLCKKWIEYWFFASCSTKVKLFFSVTQCHVIPNPFDFLSFFRKK